jgi:alkanesulfonate monooxygenase SsuD/methylene tetrahydromethanopterin reductase-like flavin-dependent oxidoreductase (luciferase family)
MADYGHDLLFGIFPTPTAADPDRAIALAQLAEQSGLDLVTVQDHPYQPRFLDAWTLLSVIAARTSRISVAPNVANLPLRHPAVLGRSAASLDLITGGRVELGLGAGTFWDAIEANGGPRRSPGQSVEALAEAIGVIRALWDTGTPGGARIPGKHYPLTGAKRGPAPAHDIGIWLGAIKPRMLRLTGRLADGWWVSSGYLPPEVLPDLNRTIDQAAEKAGRSPSAIRRLYNLSGSFDAVGNGFLRGPERVWAEQLTELTLTEGMTGYIIATDDPDDIRRFADVANQVRSGVAAARSVGTPPAGAGPVAEVSAVTAQTGPAPAGGLDVVPTPDDGVRRSTTRPWDESERPIGPAPEPGQTYPHRTTARQLVAVHDGLRGELAQIRDLVDQVRAGTLDPGVARSAINTMTMRQNNWTLGAYCESYCRLVTTHHTAEDQSLFPALRSADPRLKPVVDRLEYEHTVIHDVLDQVDEALVALVSAPDGMDQLTTAMDLLSDTLLSHLSYEERELIEPLARLGH